MTLPGINNLGDRVYYTDARSLSLGGISSLTECSRNPASLVFVDRTTLSFTPSYILASEHRGLRVYDSYGNNIGTSTITQSIDQNIGIAAGFFIVPYKNLRISLQYAPLWVYNYYYQREYRDDFYQIFRIETHDHNGLIYSLAPAISFSYKFLSIGVREDFIRGKKDALISVIEPYLPDSIVQQHDSYKGTATRVGIVILPDKHLALAYSYVTEYAIESEQLGSELNYPASHTIGCFYQPAARIPTRFYGEFSHEAWSEAINIYKIGIEHMIVEDYSIRYGFCIFPDYEQDAVWTTVLSIGGGYQTERLHFDIAYSYNKRDYSSNDFTGLEDLGNIQIDESLSIFLISLGFKF